MAGLVRSDGLGINLNLNSETVYEYIRAKTKHVLRFKSLRRGLSALMVHCQNSILNLKNKDLFGLYHT